jgi:type IV secretion system protein VirB9
MRADRTLLVLLLALGIGGRSQAENVPQAGVTDPRIRTAAYSSDQVYELYGFVGFHLDLEFEPGESFLGLSAGDPAALTYAAHDHILTLRPRSASSHMNLAVSTSKRRYYFEYTIFAREPGPDEVMYAVRFAYPPPATPKDALTPQQRVDAELARAKTIRPVNYDYWFCGNSSVRPIAASDDGVHTRMTFASHAELPAIFVRNDDDTESLLNFSIDEGDVVIHRVAARFVVRRGKLTGCIVNKGFVGSGGRLTSGTVATDVIRQSKGSSNE